MSGGQLYAYSYRTDRCDYRDADGWHIYAQQYAMKVLGVDINKYRHRMLIMPRCDMHGGIYILTVGPRGAGGGKEVIAGICNMLQKLTFMAGTGADFVLAPVDLGSPEWPRRHHACVFQHIYLQISFGA